MSKRAFVRALIGAVAPLVLVVGATRADWRTPIAGAKPILQSRFTPAGVAPAARATTMAAVPPPAGPAALEGLTTWSFPLVDRPLTAAEKAADIAPEMQDAILRIEPIYDPTRLDGPDSPPRKGLAAGTAAMDNVFADRWRMADPDANVNVKVTYLADAWQMKGDLPCDAFTKNRSRGYNYVAPILNALTSRDCRLLLRYEARGFDDPAPVPIAAGPTQPPVFAAPMPGTRLSSEDFWAAQKARIAAIEAQLRLRQGWHGGVKGLTVGLARQ